MVKKCIFASKKGEFTRPNAHAAPLIVLQQTTQSFLATHCSVIPARSSIRQWVSLVKTSYALNSFRISNIQEQELGCAGQDVTMLHVRPKARLKFLRSTGFGQSHAVWQKCTTLAAELPFRPQTASISRLVSPKKGLTFAHVGDLGRSPLPTKEEFGAILEPLGLEVIAYRDEPKLYLMVARKS